MNILLTGATGFLGSHLLKALISEGYDITVLKRSSSNCRRIQENLDKCRVYDIDCVTLDTVFHNRFVDAVIHCATEYGKKAAQAVETVNGNLIFPLQVLEAAISAKCPYFINTDSFFTKQLPARFLQSQELYSPEYTLSKYQFREWGRLRAIERKINFINLQMEHIYGPDDGEEKFVAFLIRTMQNEVKELDLTDGIQIRDFIHVDDVVAAYLVILARLGELSGYCHFEVGTGISRTVRELTETIHAELDASTKLNFGGVPRKGSEIMFSTARQITSENISLAAQISLETGIRKTIEWIRKTEEK